MPDFVQTCRDTLARVWDSVQAKVSQNAGYNTVPDELFREVVSRCINSPTKSYRYVLPTQLVAKLTDPKLDSRCLQSGRGGAGYFDARSVCDKVVVPFDRNNHNVLGGAPEPYVSNPLRVPEISEQYKTGKKDKAGWDDLVHILDIVESTNKPEFTEAVFAQSLIETYRRLASVQITYPIPRRISLSQCQNLILQFLAASSGGERALTTLSALMEVVGEEFRIFREVKRSRITAADSASGMVADIECHDSEGKIALAIEVKDKELVVNHILSKLPTIRSKQVSEILFIAQRGIQHEDRKSIDALIQREFVSGQNIYIFEDIVGFASSILALLGEPGRHKFLAKVGTHLDRYGATVENKRAWAALLSAI